MGKTVQTISFLAALLSKTGDYNTDKRLVSQRLGPGAVV